MIDKTNIAENDILSLRNRKTMSDVKEILRRYVEYECVLTTEGDGIKIEDDVRRIIQPFVDNLKIRTYYLIINELNENHLVAQLFVKLVDGIDFTVIDFTVDYQPIR